MALMLELSNYVTLARFSNSFRTLLATRFSSWPLSKSLSPPIVALP
jgi:hypothetical protein